MQPEWVVGVTMSLLAETGNNTYKVNGNKIKWVFT